MQREISIKWNYTRRKADVAFPTLLRFSAAEESFRSMRVLKNNHTDRPHMIFVCTSERHAVRGFAFVRVQCCGLKSTETIRTIRDGVPRTSTSTLTQLLSSDQSWVQRCCTFTETIRTIRDVHLDCLTAPELWPVVSLAFCTSTETVRTIRDVHLDCLIAPELWPVVSSMMLQYRRPQSPHERPSTST